MKVLYLINGEFYAGAERVQDILALALPSLGCTVDFACLKRGVFITSRHAKASQVFPVEMSSRVDLRPSCRIARLLREGGYDLLHTHTPRAVMLGAIAARLAHRPMVHHVHGPTSISRGSIGRDIGNRIAERFGMTRAQRIVVVSRRLGHTLEHAGIDRQRIRVIANGVAVNRAVPDWSPPRTRWEIGIVALFRPRKGLETVLNAVHLLRSRGYDAGLRAVGNFEDEAYRQSTLALAQQLGIDQNVTWVGFSHDVTAELAHMHVFVFPSVLGEGLPMALIEAMAVGLPVVASEVEGVEEVLTPDGAGILVRPGLASALADGIASIIECPDTAAKMAREGHRRQMECYSDEAMARSLLGVYQEVLYAHPRVTTSPILSQESD